MPSQPQPPTPDTGSHTASGFDSREFVRLQQELIAVRTRLDRQIAQLTRLNRISNALLFQELGERRLETFAETIADVLDMAIGVVWEVQDDQVLQLAACGLEAEESLWRQIGLDLLALVKGSGRPSARRLEPQTLQRLGDHDLCDLLLCPASAWRGTASAWRWRPTTPPSPACSTRSATKPWRFSARWRNGSRPTSTTRAPITCR